MTPTEFRAELSRLGLTQTGAARALGIEPRTVRRYASGATPVSRVIELALIGVAVDSFLSASKATSAAEPSESAPAPNPSGSHIKRTK